MTAKLMNRLTAGAALILVAALGATAGALAAGMLAMLLSSAAPALALGSNLPWYITRAAGVTAYLLLSTDAILGLAISTRLLDRLISRASSFILHEWLAWLALGATGLHVIALLVDTVQPFSFADILIPLAASYRPIATGLGVIAMYLAVLITLSFYVRRRIGGRAWRTLHYATFALFVLATVHGITAGATQDLGWMQWAYTSSATLVGFMTAWRVVNGRRAARRASATAHTPMAR
jgi:sulfoxide reductase heme-binding subunit YedZ